MKKKWLIVFTGALLGILISSQYISYKKVSEIVARDVNSNAFSEIHVLKTSNEALQEEIQNLKSILATSSDQWTAREALQKELLQKEMLLGTVGVKGSGISIRVETPIEAIWLVDIVNELFTAGAEAISINEIRLTESTIGFDGSLKNQILIRDSLLTAPYVIKAIGEKKILDKAVTQAGGLMPRLKLAYPDLKIAVSQEDSMEMVSSGA